MLANAADLLKKHLQLISMQFVQESYMQDISVQTEVLLQKAQAERQQEERSVEEWKKITYCLKKSTEHEKTEIVLPRNIFQRKVEVFVSYLRQWSCHRTL